MTKETKAEIKATEIAKAEARQDRADARAEAKAEDEREVRAQIKADALTSVTAEAGEIMSPTVPAIERDKWEYLVITGGERADLNPYGADGWELVFTSEHGFNERVYHFKRPQK